MSVNNSTFTLQQRNFTRRAPQVWHCGSIDCTDKQRGPNLRWARSVAQAKDDGSQSLAGAGGPCCVLEASVITVEIRTHQAALSSEKCARIDGANSLIQKISSHRDLSCVPYYPRYEIATRVSSWIQKKNKLFRQPHRVTYGRIATRIAISTR